VEAHRDRVAVPYTAVVRSLVAGGGVGVGVAVTPVDDVAGDRVLTRVRDRANSQGVGRALVHVGRAAQTDGRRDVVHGDAQAAGIGEGAVLVGEVDRDRVAVGPVGVGVRLVAGRGVRVGRTITPLHDLTADR